MAEEEEEEEDDENIPAGDGPIIGRPLVEREPNTTRNPGRVLPSEFKSSVDPTVLFPFKSIRFPPTGPRYVHRDDDSKRLIFADGACLNNGQPNPRAGWAFVVGDRHVVSSRLEASGPSGDTSIQSSNRAELRAVIAALEYRAWHGEGCKHLIIATDSEYVVKGATKWAKTWLRNGWKTKGNADVKNKDMWGKLLDDVEERKNLGLSIGLWHIPRHLNAVADAAAKSAAAVEETPNSWKRVCGVLV